ncbi:MAG: hypothetical protein JWO89_692, partial [Verrucomicrobiaceae bacterium]|nr:hypothetical protein [Verrucomicrobiaceae bacterium]
IHFQRHLLLLFGEFSVKGQAQGSEKEGG